MKVLFVSSGNSKKFKIAPFIKAQADSLAKLGSDIDFFTISGKGIRGYLQNVLRLKKYLKKNPVDIIHVHYSLSGWIAVLVHPGIPIVLSLMGSDVYGEYIGYKKVKFTSRYLTLLTLCIQPFVSAIISKSRNIDAFVYRRNIAHIIPNGVVLENCKLEEKNYAKAKLGLQEEKRYVLFLGDKNNKRKNYRLLADTLNKLEDENLVLLAPFPISYQEVGTYLNASDVFALASFNEGSPNVIKEAMACGCPIVSTDVGDVRWILGDTEGCYITSFDSEDVVEKLRQAMKFADTVERTKGRERIMRLALDSESVAIKIRNLYQSLLEA